MKLIVVRHGETELNEQQRYVGGLDPALNPRGVVQADTLRGLLPGPFDVVLSSPRLRAIETANILCLGQGVTPLILAAFRERSVGVFEGLTRNEVFARYPELWLGNVTRNWDLAPPGGETIEAVATRTALGLEFLANHYAGRTVVLVTHGFVARVIRALLSRTPVPDFFDWELPNGSLLEATLTPQSRIDVTRLRVVADQGPRIVAPISTISMY